MPLSFRLPQLRLEVFCSLSVHWYCCKVGKLGLGGGWSLLRRFLGQVAALGLGFGGLCKFLHSVLQLCGSAALGFRGWVVALSFFSVCAVSKLLVCRCSWCGADQCVAPAIAPDLLVLGVFGAGQGLRNRSPSSDFPKLIYLGEDLSQISKFMLPPIRPWPFLSLFHDISRQQPLQTYSIRSFQFILGQIYTYVLIKLGKMNITNKNMDHMNYRLAHE